MYRSTSSKTVNINDTSFKIDSYSYDGKKTVSGKAEPYAAIDGRINGRQVATTTADADGNWSFDLELVPNGRWELAVFETHPRNVLYVPTDDIYYRTRFITNDGMGWESYMNLSPVNYANTNGWDIHDRWEYFNWLVVGTLQTNGQVGRLVTREGDEHRGIPANPLRKQRLTGATSADLLGFGMPSEDNGWICITDSTQLTTAGTRNLKLQISENGLFTDTQEYAFTLRIVSGSEITNSDDASYFWADAANGGNDANSGRRPDLPKLTLPKGSSFGGYLRGKHYFKTGSVFVGTKVLFGASSPSDRWYYQYGDPCGVEPIIDVGGPYCDTYWHAARPVSNISKANPAVVTTAAAHGYINGNRITLFDIAGMTSLNQQTFTIANVTATTFQLVGLDTTNYPAYISGGNAYRVDKALNAFGNVFDSSGNLQGGTRIAYARGLWFKGGERPVYIWDAPMDIKHCRMSDNYGSSNAQGAGHTGTRAIIFRWNRLSNYYGDGLYCVSSNNGKINFNRIGSPNGGAGDNIQFANHPTMAQNINLSYNILESDPGTTSLKGKMALAGLKNSIIEGNGGTGNYFYLSAGGQNNTFRNSHSPFGGLIGKDSHNTYMFGFSNEFDIIACSMYDCFTANSWLGFSISKVSGSVKRWDLEITDCVAANCTFFLRITETWSGMANYNLSAGNAIPAPDISGGVGIAGGAGYTGIYMNNDSTIGNIQQTAMPIKLPAKQPRIKGSTDIHTAVAVNTVLTIEFPEIREGCSASVEWRINGKRKTPNATGISYTVVATDLTTSANNMPSGTAPEISALVTWTDVFGQKNKDIAIFPNPGTYATDDERYLGGKLYQKIVS